MNEIRQYILELTLAQRMTKKIKAIQNAVKRKAPKPSEEVKQSADMKRKGIKSQEQIQKDLKKKQREFEDERSRLLRKQRVGQ